MQKYVEEELPKIKPPFVLNDSVDKNELKR